MVQPKFQRKNRNTGSSLEMAQYLGAGTNKIKKRIRDIERLLIKKKDILPDTVILEKERTLEGLKLELENAGLNQIAKKYATKYHMVRFFERKKALKKYKQLLKKLEIVEETQRKELNENLFEKKIDLCYIVNFPKTEKYISLYPNADAEKTKNSSTDVRRTTIRDLIIKQLENNTLPVTFEDILKGKTLDKDAFGVHTNDNRKRSNNNKNNSNSNDSEDEKSNKQEDEDEEDDFFN